jgi:hypothetical protein
MCIFAGTARFRLVPVLLALLLTAAAGRGAAEERQIYRSVDADGNVVFSDQPATPNATAEPVELPSPNTFSPPPRQGEGVRLEVWLAGDEAREQAAASGRYQVLRIADPPDDAGLRDNAGNVTVTGELQPDLLPGHAVQLLLDGVLAQTAAQARFELVNVDRGSHSLELRVVDEAGNILISSAPSTFHLQRRSLILQPAASPPKP